VEGLTTAARPSIGRIGPSVLSPDVGGICAECTGHHKPAPAHLRRVDQDRRTGQLSRSFHTTGVTAALSSQCLPVVRGLARHTDHARDVLLSFDVNYRPALWDRAHAAPMLLDQARRANIAFVGCDKADELWGTARPQAIRALLPHAPQLVIKDSSSAAYSFMNDTTIAVPALRTAVVEPAERGAAFAARFLSGLLHGADRRTALRYGHLLASAALSTVADQVVPPAPPPSPPPLPSMTRHGHVAARRPVAPREPATPGDRPRIQAFPPMEDTDDDQPQAWPADGGRDGAAT